MRVEVLVRIVETLKQDNMFRSIPRGFLLPLCLHRSYSKQFRCFDCERCVRLRLRLITFHFLRLSRKHIFCFQWTCTRPPVCKETEDICQPQRRMMLQLFIFFRNRQTSSFFRFARKKIWDTQGYLCEIIENICQLGQRYFFLKIQIFSIFLLDVASLLKELFYN